MPWYKPLPDANLRRLAAVLRLGSRIFCAATQLLARSLDNLSVSTMQRPASEELQATFSAVGMINFCFRANASATTTFS